MEKVDNCCMCGCILNNFPIIIKQLKYCNECAEEKIKKDKEEKKKNEKA